MISKHKRLMQTQSYGRGNINATSRCQSTQIKIHRNTNLVYANGKITKYKNKLHFWKILSGAHVTNTFKNIVDSVNNTFNGPSDAEQLTCGLFPLIFLTRTHSPFFLPSIAVAISHCLTFIVWPQSIKGHYVLNARRGVFAKSLSGWAAQDRQGGEGVVVHYQHDYLVPSLAGLPLPYSTHFPLDKELDCAQCQAGERHQGGARRQGDDASIVIYTKWSHEKLFGKC